MTPTGGRATVHADAAAIYAAEDHAAATVPLRRFGRFADIEAHVVRLTTSSWWDDRFPGAPVEVEVHRRSHSATVSCSTIDPDRVGLIALVDGRGWGLETVLHELAHVAAGIGAGHGDRFRRALLDLWRHDAGVQAWAALESALAEHPVPR